MIMYFVGWTPSCLSDQLSERWVADVICSAVKFCYLDIIHEDILKYFANYLDIINEDIL